MPRHVGKLAAAPARTRVRPLLRAKLEPARSALPAAGPCPCGGGCPRCKGAHDAVPDTSGRPLDPSVAARMQRAFGRDFSDVRIHTGAAASAAAGQRGAEAYAVGSDIVFAEGRYDPDAAGGDSLIAHELAHVVQQSAAGTSGRALLDAPRAEAEARRTAAAVVHGRRAPALGVAAVAPARSAIPNKSGPRFSKVLGKLRWTWSVADPAQAATKGAERAYAAIVPQIVASTESRGVSFAQALILVAQAQTEQYATSQQPASARNRLFNMMPTQTEFDLWKKSLSAADRNKVFAGGDSKKSQPVDFLPAAGVSIKMYDSPEFDREQNKLVMKQSPFFVYDSVEHSVEHFITRMQGFESGWYKPDDPAVKPLRERYRAAGIVGHLQKDDATAAGYGAKLKSLNYATGKHYKEEINNRYRLVLGDFLKMIEDAVAANDPSASGSADPETLAAYESLASFRTELTAALARTPFMPIPKN